MHGRLYRRRKYRSHDDDHYNDLPVGLLIHPSNLVVTDEDELVDTGLLGPDGEPIVRPARDPIGYLWDQFE